MKKIVMFVFLMMTSAALAETKSDGTPKVPEDVVITVPGKGEDVVVNVPYIVEQVHELPPTTVIRKESNLLLRGGLVTGIGKHAHADPALTGGLVGEIGYADSRWRLEASFRAGSCRKGWGDVALDSELAVMGSITKNFRAGIGADLLYCSDVSDHPKEKASERIAGGSLRLAVEQGHFSLTGSVGIGAATTPIPGDRETKAVLFGGLALSVFWGGK